MSDPDLQKLIEKNIEISSQTLKETKKVRRQLLVGNILHSLKWVIIILAIIAGYFYAAPYFKGAISAYRELLGDFNIGPLNELSSFTEKPEIEQILK